MKRFVFGGVVRGNCLFGAGAGSDLGVGCSDSRLSVELCVLWR